MWRCHTTVKLTDTTDLATVRAYVLYLYICCIYSLFLSTILIVPICKVLFRLFMWYAAHHSCSHTNTLRASSNKYVYYTLCMADKLFHLQMIIFKCWQHAIPNSFPFRRNRWVKCHFEIGKTLDCIESMHEPLTRRIYRKLKQHMCMKRRKRAREKNNHAYDGNFWWTGGKRKEKSANINEFSHLYVHTRTHTQKAAFYPICLPHVALLLFTILVIYHL